MLMRLNAALNEVGHFKPFLGLPVAKVDPSN